MSFLEPIIGCYFNAVKKVTDNEEENLLLILKKCGHLRKRVAYGLLFISLHPTNKVLMQEMWFLRDTFTLLSWNPIFNPLAYANKNIVFMWNAWYFRSLFPVPSPIMQFLCAPCMEFVENKQKSSNFTV